MSQSFIAGAPIGGLETSGPIPAGMLRIHKGIQERYVWPVHLPGWLALGWQVAGPSFTTLDPLPQAVMAPATAAALESDPEPQAGRGKRGRRRKEEPEQPPAAIEATPEETATAAESGVTESESHTATDLAAETAAEPADDSTAEGALALSALPDDLFSDPLI
ncbi:MAG: hypothetical protein WAM11_04795 [Cyanobium sp.]